MTKNKKVTIRKLYQGCASIRKYIVEECLNKEKGIQINYKEWTMTVSYNALNNFFQFHKKKFESKYNTRKYELMDMKFVPDRMNG